MSGPRSPLISSTGYPSWECEKSSGREKACSVIAISVVAPSGPEVELNFKCWLFSGFTRCLAKVAIPLTHFVNLKLTLDVA
jgi:hypothetical protein